MEKSTRLRESTADAISPVREKVKIQLTKKNSSKDLMLMLTNVFYLSNSLLNLIRLGHLNDARIYNYNND